MNPRDFSGLSYRIRRQEEGWYLELRVRYRRNGNEIVLWPEICEQIWELCGEMPTEVADLIPRGRLGMPSSRADRAGPETP